MVRKANHSLLDNAKANKKDEFYTQLSDVERELRFYKKHFKDKIVFCNCDDARISNFYKYFVQNFKQLGLKRLICACCKKTEPAFYYEYADNGKRNPTLKDVSFFKGDGDFRSGESVELLKKSGHCRCQSALFLVSGIHFAVGRVWEKIFDRRQYQCDYL